jgi:hypothetical protein
LFIGLPPVTRRTLLRADLFGGGAIPVGALWYNQPEEISMEWLWLLVGVAGWLTLMKWVLPRLGVKT